MFAAPAMLVELVWGWGTGQGASAGALVLAGKT